MKVFLQFKVEHEMKFHSMIIRLFASEYQLSKNHIFTFISYFIYNVMWHIVNFMFAFFVRFRDCRYYQFLGEFLLSMSVYLVVILWKKGQKEEQLRLILFKIWWKDSVVSLCILHNTINGTQSLRAWHTVIEIYDFFVAILFKIAKNRKSKYAKRWRNSNFLERPAQTIN
jgi:hypothetical protein